MNKEQKDALGEIFNIGMGKTLKALNLVSHSKYEIKFTIPKVDVISKDKLTEALTKSEQQSIILQSYQGAIEGDALLFFPDNSTLAMIQLLIGTDFPPEELARLEHDALLEVGNIIINTSLSSLANFLNEELVTGLPKYYHFQDKSFKKILNRIHGSELIQLGSRFSLEEKELAGEVALILSEDSMRKLLCKISELFQ